MSAQNDIETSLAAYNAENDKFNKGNAAAGTRARKALVIGVLLTIQAVPIPAEP